MSGKRQFIPAGEGKRLVIPWEKGETAYVTITDQSVDVTIPRENDPSMTQIRIFIEKLCFEINKKLGGVTDEEIEHRANL